VDCGRGRETAGIYRVASIGGKKKKIRGKKAGGGRTHWQDSHGADPLPGPKINYNLKEARVLTGG